jgi:TLD
VLSQISLFLSETITFDNFQPEFQYSTSSHSSPVSLSPLQTILQTYTEPLLILIHGRSNKGHQTTFGAFFPVPGKEIPQADRSPGFEDSLLFQLSPVHDVFRSVTGKAAWDITEHTLWCGAQDAGVAFGLAENLAEATILHRLGEGAAYEANTRRGPWEENVRIENVEIWSDLIWVSV